MTFEDVKENIWIQYNNEYWFVNSVRQDVCHYTKQVSQHTINRY